MKQAEHWAHPILANSGPAVNPCFFFFIGGDRIVVGCGDSEGISSLYEVHIVEMQGQQG